MNFLAQKRSKILLQNGDSNHKQPPVSDPQSNFYYEEISKLTGSGGWSVDFKRKRTYLDAEAKRILEIPEGYHTSLRNALDFYADDSKDKAMSFYMACSEGKSFTTTLKMQTFSKKEFWVRASGKPIYDDSREIVGIHGVFQDISSDKEREMELLKSMNIVESQNEKLNNFTSIITHSMRSHAGNLAMTLELMKDAKSLEEKEELCEGLYVISESISNTIGHLTALSAIQTNAKADLEPVDINKVLEKVKGKLRNTLSETRTEIFSDFSEVPSVDYIPSYMESILLNLITNAIKYRHPDRSPVIEIYSVIEDEIPCLLVKDNGLGIDLSHFGDRIFNIYETFHSNQNSEGVGLFLLKNKIESLQGTIDVQSEVNKGTTFIVRF